MLAVGGRDGVVRLIDLAGGKETVLLKGHTDAVSCIAFSPDGATLATGSKGKDRSVRLWDVAGRREEAGRAAQPVGRVRLLGVFFAGRPDGGSRLRRRRRPALGRHRRHGKGRRSGAQAAGAARRLLGGRPDAGDGRTRRDGQVLAHDGRRRHQLTTFTGLFIKPPQPEMYHAGKGRLPLVPSGGR